MKEACAGRRRRVLPRALAVQGRLRRDRPAGRRGHRRGRARRRRGRIVYLGGLRPAETDGELSDHLSFAGPGRRRVPALRGPGRGPAGRRDPGRGFGQLRDAALPDRATARDGDAALGRHARAADRRARRPALPRRRRRLCPRGEPHVRPRRARRPDLPSDDAAVRGRGRPAAAADHRRPRADALAELAVGERGDAGAEVAGDTADRVARARDGVPRARHRPVRPRPDGRPDRLHAGRRTRAGEDQGRRGGDPLVGRVGLGTRAPVLDPLPTDPDWTGGSVYIDSRCTETTAEPRPPVGRRQGHRRLERLVLVPARLGRARLGGPARRRRRACAAAGATRRPCSSARRWTGGGSRRWTRRAPSACCACARR